MPTEQFSVDGRTVVVTGGSSGIGRTIAERFAADGATVTICSREQKRVDEAAADIETTDEPGDVLPLECDIRDRNAVDAMIAATVDAFGHPDVLVNNAGANFYADFEDISANGWQTIQDVNLTGTVNCLQTALDPMRAGGGGAVVNLSSFVAEYPSPNQSHYGAAKAAVAQLTKTVAHEWAEYDIRMNAVAPGVILTPGVEHVLDGSPNEIPGREVVDRQIGHPSEVADLVQFLVSPASSFLTGEVIPVRGIPQPANVDARFPE